MKRGDIYYIKQNATANEGDADNPSGRPAIIVSNDAHLEQLERVQIVYLTTRDTDDSPTNVDIRSTSRPSIALCGQISWVFKSKIGDFVCSITPYELMMVDIALATSLGLSFDKPEKKEKDKRVVPDTATMPDVPPAKFEPVGAEMPRPGAAVTKPQVELGIELLRAETERDIYKELCDKLLDRVYKACDAYHT